MFDQRGELPLLPLCRVMDRDSTGETPSALCPLQEAGFTLNQLSGYVASISEIPRISKRQRDYRTVGKGEVKWRAMRTFSMRSNSAVS